MLVYWRVIHSLLGERIWNNNNNNDDEHCFHEDDDYQRIIVQALVINMIRNDSFQMFQLGFNQHSVPIVH